MKYALNHQKEFEHPFIVWSIGLMQFTMVIIVELMNMFIISGASNIVNVVMNFIALGIIANFDDTFFEALPKRLISHIDMTLMIKHTSSTRSDDLIRGTDYKIDDVYWVSISKEEPEGEEEFPEYKVEALEHFSREEREKFHRKKEVQELKERLKALKAKEDLDEKEKIEIKELQE